MRVLAIALVALVALAGCGGSKGSDRGPIVGSFVGEVAGTDAFVAVVAGKRNVAAYVCDGAHGIAELFTGQRANGRVELASTGGATLAASIAADGSSGTVTLPGMGEHEFSAKPATGEAGFYRVARIVKGRRVTAGWVVLSDGRQRGSIAGSEVKPATRTASVPSIGTIGVSLVTPTLVSAAGFGGGFSFGKS